jgi:hypothetical protein
MAIAESPRLGLGPGEPSAIRYERHEPEKTLLHRVVREDLEPFLQRSRSAGAPVARFVEREVRAYLECGVLAHGFLRVHCDACGHDRLVAFSCKGRGFCPSCGGRRMADTAAHLVDRVLPEVPVRQWVLTLPYPLRYRCAWNARLTSEVLRCFLRAVFADYRRRAKRDLGVRGGACGSVTFIQRFDSALNLTPHFHTLVLDGVYDGGTNTPGRFRALDPPETDDVARVLAGTARRIRRRLEALGIEEGEDRMAEDEPLLAMLTAASIRSRIATGPEAGAPWRRLGDRVDPDSDEQDEDGVEPGARIPPRCVRHGGMSLHADVAVPARDRRRLERLCRYVARPPLALERLEELSDDRLAYRLKTPWRDGTTRVVMERTELLERLAPLVPPPRAHQVRYHGVLAPCASGRDRVVPRPVEAPRDPVAVAGRSIVGNVDPTLDLGVGAGGSSSPEKPGPLSTGARGTSNPREADDGSLPVVLPTGSPVPDVRAAEGERSSSATRAPADRRGDSRRTAWADLLQRVFEVDALRCPGCGARMRVLSAITDPDVAHRILDCLKMPSRAPPLAASKPRAEERSDEPSSELDWGDDPGFDFDQSGPEFE